MESAVSDSGTGVHEVSDCVIGGALARLIGIVVAMETAVCISSLSGPRKITPRLGAGSRQSGTD